MSITLFRNKEKSDASLMNLYQQDGDTDVLGVLFQRYMHLVYGVCLKFLNNKQDAQDAVVEVYEKLSKELLLKQVDSFKPWLYVVTKNYCLMYLRKQKSAQNKEREFEKDERVFMESEDTMHLNNEAWEPDELDKRLQECLGALRDKQKACIELFYFKELCYREISDKLKIELKKVKSYIQNGKRNLKICIESNNV